MSEVVSEAKQTLLRALDSITAVEEDTGAEVQHVAVVWSVHHTDEEGTVHDQGGWNHSDAPAWLVAAMLRHGADAIEDSVVSGDDGEA